MSIEQFFIIDHQFTYEELFLIFERTPHLSHSNIYTFDEDVTDELMLTLPSMTKWSVSLTESLSNTMIKFLDQMSNLRHLVVNTFCRINGYEWERIITDHAPQLKTFRLEMCLDYQEGLIDDLLDSFLSNLLLDCRTSMVCSL
ncbi:hypothetical protein I4U23_005658 [Adineta vaga]|nr:hypothetical protein I4U23_005658 [Adineta vaga]